MRHITTLLCAAAAMLTLCACPGNNDFGEPIYNSPVADTVTGTYVGHWRINQDEADEGAMTVTDKEMRLAAPPYKSILTRLLGEQEANQAITNIEAGSYTVAYSLLGTSDNSSIYELSREPYLFIYHTHGTRKTVRVDFRDKSQAVFSYTSGMLVVVLQVAQVAIMQGDSQQVFTPDWTLTFYPDRHESSYLLY